MTGIGQQQPAFQFGVFELNPHTGELRKHGVKLKLQDQPVQILTLLLEHPGEIVTREEIQKRLWPENTYVDFDNAINTAIRKLRDALSDSPNNPRFIETLARRGYRFIAPVSRAALHDALQEKQAISISPRKPVITTRRWSIFYMTAALLIIAGIGLRWHSFSDRSSHDTPLPAVPLTGNPGYEAFPAFSPEGTRVAYSWQEPGKQTPNIYVKLIGQGDPVRLTTGAEGDFAPAWSPDGGSIAFLRARGSFRAAIILIPSLGGPERQLTEINLAAFELLEHFRAYQVPAPFLAWSPDGRWLLSVYLSAPHETVSIIRISIETGNKRTLTFPPNHISGDGSLALSPDGKTLAFTRTRRLVERDIYTIRLSRDMLPLGDPKRLTFDDKDIAGLAWTADGRSLAFSSIRGGRRELWQMPVQHAGQPVRLTAAGDDPRDVAIALEGRRLMYSHQVWYWHVWRAGLDGKDGNQTRALILSTRADIHAHYSPDGRRIAFESNRSGNDEIWVCQADGSHPVQLTSFRNAWAGSPRWSPDGQRIAFDGNAGGNWDIYIVGSQGGQPVRLTTSGSDAFRPSWSHDGKWIYYGSTLSGHRQIWKIPAKGGPEIQVTRNGGYVAFESADRQDLYYTKEQGLWKMPVRGGNEVRVVESLLANNFAPAKRGLYFVEPAGDFDDKPRLKFLDFASQNIETRALLPGPLGNEIGISPDERWILFDKSDRTDSELMLIENFR